MPNRTQIEAVLATIREAADMVREAGQEPSARICASITSNGVNICGEKLVVRAIGVLIHSPAPKQKNEV